MWEQSFRPECVLGRRQAVRFWPGFVDYVEANVGHWGEHVGWYRWSELVAWVRSDGTDARWQDCQKAYMRSRVNHICPACTYGYSWDRPEDWMLV